MADYAKCSAAGCNKPVHAKGLCSTHYKFVLRRNESKYFKETMAAYTEHAMQKLADNPDELGIEQGFFFNELAKAALEVLKRNNPIDLKTWIEENITLPPGNGFRNRNKMDFEMFPHMKYILNLADNPDCKRIVLCFAAQSGKTDTIISIAAYLTGYRCRRGLYVLPTSRMFDKVRDSRIKPLLASSNVGFKELKNLSMFIFENGNFFPLALMSSPATMAEQTGTSWVILDELDECNQKNKGDPVSLAEKRMQTSLRRLTIIACTPKRLETGYTYYHYNRCKRFVEEIQCPLCNGWFVPDFYKHFRWPQNANRNDIEIDMLAWIECPFCNGRITDSMHFEIVTKRKRWKDLDPELPIAECGFRLPIFLTLNKNISATAAEYVRALTDNMAMEDFNNSWLARPVEKEIRSGGDIDFAPLKGNWLCAHCEIPDDVFCTTAGVDVGGKEIWLVLLGWGKEGRKFVIRSEKIERGRGSGSFAAAMAVAMDKCNPASYKAKGRRIKFYGGFIDSGDGNDTPFIYEFCRCRGGEWLPTKGSANRDKLFWVSEADPRRQYRGKYNGLPLIVISTEEAQNTLHVHLQTSPKEPNSFLFAEDAPEMLYEHIRNQKQERNKNGLLRWGKDGDKPDHLRDALFSAMVAGYYHEVNNLVFSRPVAPQPPNQFTFRKAGNIYGG